jgi:mRNA-degrading endonuclease RelE of RelBE toxin-antitoxin system
VYRVFFTKRCEQRHRKLQDSVKREVNKVIEEISQNPHSGYPLKDPILKGLYSIHAGDYRVVYKFTDNPAEIELWAVEHRSHVYDELLRYRMSSND